MPAAADRHQEQKRLVSGGLDALLYSGAIARALVSAVQTLPDYTFTAESFPCPRVRLVRGAPWLTIAAVSVCAALGVLFAFWRGERPLFEQLQI
jgi:hypothetical protein